jgi:hypothetical protein
MLHRLIKQDLNVFSRDCLQLTCTASIAGLVGASWPAQATLSACSLSLSHLYFGVLASACADTKVYKDITDQDKMLHVVGEYLADMNAGSKKPQNLVLFQFALEHVARISRIITSPGAQSACNRLQAGCRAAEREMRLENTLTSCTSGEYVC